MLTGKNVIVTGASEGLGKEAAREFLRKGANICICARNGDKLRSTAAELETEKLDDAQVFVYCRTDIGSTEQTDRLYEFAASRLGSLSAVVNNAGIYGPIGDTAQVCWKDMEEVVRVNLLGTLYSMRKAVSVFRSQRSGGRIINLSGGGATAPMPNFMGYAVTKTAVVRATETMAQETRDDGIYINAVAPGAMNTRLLEQVLEAGRAAAGAEFYERSLEQKRNGGASLENAAQLVAYLALEESACFSGRLISAVWDDWKGLKMHEDALAGSDVYTLRRIIPADRGFDWG